MVGSIGSGCEGTVFFPGHEHGGQRDLHQQRWISAEAESPSLEYWAARTPAMPGRSLTKIILAPLISWLTHRRRTRPSPTTTAGTRISRIRARRQRDDKRILTGGNLFFRRLATAGSATIKNDGGTISSASDSDLAYRDRRQFQLDRQIGTTVLQLHDGRATPPSRRTPAPGQISVQQQQRASITMRAAPSTCRG